MREGAPSLSNMTLERRAGSQHVFQQGVTQPAGHGAGTAGVGSPADGTALEVADAHAQTGAGEQQHLAGREDLFAADGAFHHGQALRRDLAGGAGMQPAGSKGVLPAGRAEFRVKE